jgi:hypothetical protein
MKRVETMPELNALIDGEPRGSDRTNPSVIRFDGRARSRIGAGFNNRLRATLRSARGGSGGRFVGCHHCQHWMGCALFADDDGRPASDALHVP